MSNSNQRLVDFIESKGISKAKFAQAIGITPQTLSNYTNGRSTLDANRIAQIAECFPELNIEWLITGRGEMLRTYSDNTQTVYDSLLNKMEEALINRIVQRITPGSSKSNFSHQYALATAAAF